MVRQFLPSLPLCTNFSFFTCLWYRGFVIFLYFLFLFLLMYVGFFYYVVRRKQDKIKIKILFHSFYVDE